MNFIDYIDVPLSDPFKKNRIKKKKFILPEIGRIYQELEKRNGARNNRTP